MAPYHNTSGSLPVEWISRMTSGQRIHPADRRVYRTRTEAMQHLSLAILNWLRNRCGFV